MKSWIALFIFLTASAHADLISDFKAIEKSPNGKGPFGWNVLQTPTVRVEVRATPYPDGILFQAAFRNDIARGVAEKYDFFTGNLFTTNYYELIGEFVFSNPYGNHAVDHAGLAAKSPQALPKAASMARHWALEKYYVKQFPNTRHAKSFTYRGISGSEFELTYAEYFFNFYLGAITEEFQFLPAVLIAKESPIVPSSSLEKARRQTSVEYDELKSKYGEDTPLVRDYLEIRNAIHNQLKRSVIGMIDAYLKKFPDYLGNGHTGLVEVRQALVDFFEFKVDKIALLAGQLGHKRLQAAAKALATGGVNAPGLLELSEAAAELKTQLIIAKSTDLKKRTSTFGLLIQTTAYLNKELTALPAVTAIEQVRAIVNTVYVDGFLIVDNWQYFRGETAKFTQAKQAAAILGDLITIATDTLGEAFTPSFAQWKSVQPAMQSFIDNTLKSSSVNAAALMAGRLK